METISKGLVKVAIETREIHDMPILVEGLEKLNKADPSVDYFVNDSGEYILSTCGEVHLQRCITDLVTDYAFGVKVQVSEPIVSFKETITRTIIQKEYAKQEKNYEKRLDSDEEEEEEKKEAKEK